MDSNEDDVSQDNAPKQPEQILDQYQDVIIWWSEALRLRDLEEDESRTSS